jgi:uncharacterized lipoprotein YddW (UPF0748 family)
MPYRQSRSRCRSRRAGLPLRIASVALIVAAVHLAGVLAAGEPPVRALWIPASAIAAPASIQRAVSSAVSGGFDAVMTPLPIAVRRDGDSFDGAAELLRQARARGLGTHLSVSVNVAAAVGDIPASREHVIYQHPEWLMVPRQLAPQMLTVDVRSPAYLGQISRWTRANAERVDGLYVSPLDPAAAAYVVDAVAAAVGRYSADGIFLDALDFPGSDFDYSRRAMDLFRSHMRAEMSAAERARLDTIEAIDPFAYPNEFPGEWSQFRGSALTALLERVKSALASIGASLSISVGIRGDADVSTTEHFQAWRSWLERGIVSRVGYRNRSTDTVWLSADGVVSSQPARSFTTQASGAGGTR